MSSFPKACPNCHVPFFCLNSCDNRDRKDNSAGCFCISCLQGPQKNMDTRKEFDDYARQRSGCNLLSQRFWKDWKSYLTALWVFTKCV